MALDYSDRRPRYQNLKPIDFAKNAIQARRSDTKPRDAFRVHTDPNNAANQPVLAPKPIVQPAWDAVPDISDWTLD